MSVLDLVRSRTFAEVARRGSVSAAADALGYTQSAVSQQLSGLERELGLTLIDRAHRPLRLTPAGAELLPEVEDLLAAAGRARTAVDDLRGLRRGRVELAAFSSALAAFVPAVVAAFAREHPGVAVGLAEAEPPAAMRALRSGAADVAVVYRIPGEPPAADAADLLGAEVGEDPLHAVLPEAHPLAAGETVALAEVARLPLVVPRADGPAAAFRALVERLAAQAGRDLDVAYEVDDLRAAQAFAAAGLGAALMHGLTLRPLPAGAVARRLAPQPGARRVAVVRVRTRRAPAAAALWDVVRRHGLGAAA